MARPFTLVFAIVAYAIFFATFLYLIVFVGDLSFAGRTVDDGPESPVVVAVAIDIALIALFGLQHSIMARSGFKQWWTRIVPQSMERSVFVLAASAALILIYLLWHPIGTIVWSVTNPLLRDLIWAAFWVGWLTVLLSTFLINHFELFGLQQAWLHLRRREAAEPELRQPLFYRWVAHPIYSGFVLAFWATPEMTAGHLLFALGMTAYILIAIPLEERDLTGLYGEEYRRYRAGVGKLTPKFRRRGA